MKRLKRKVSKWLTLLLAVVMVVTMVPSTAFAEGTTNQNTVAPLGMEIAVGGNTIENAVIQTLTPTDGENDKEYKTPIQDYQSDKNQRFVWVKITIPEGSTATAKCGNSEITTLTSDEWGIIQVEGGYFWNPTYSGALTPGEYNEVIITLTKDDQTNEEYKVIIPMQPDITNQSLAWETDLVDARYITKDDTNASLDVKAQHKNRPLECEDVITYQWYKNTVASTEGGTAIAGATSATYVPDVSAVGNNYYYVVASCKNLESITSNVIAITVTEDAAPETVSIVCDHPYTIPNEWVKALGGVSYVAKPGDTLRLKAVDENGKETPVEWLNTSMNGGLLETKTGIYTITGSSYSYVQVASLYDASIKSEEKAIVVADYSVNQYNKTPSVTLVSDGQSFNKISAQGGLDGYTIWKYDFSDENIAELITDTTLKKVNLQFTAMRPGTIEASLELDLNGDGIGDGYGHADAATLTIKGIAVEDASGKLTKTYLEMSKANPTPTMQLKALSSTENATFTWSSADETVATVDENGLITAKGVGSVIVSANDGTYTGGIKVVVTSADTPYFEQIDFTITNTWGSGLSNATWKTSTFKAKSLEYTGLKMTKAAASTLTLNNATVYNTDKYTAVANYTDVNGEVQSVAINSGAVTELKNLPFETNTITITLTDKEDATKVTTYTFEITRPRDTTKTIANSGITFVPDGREVWKDQYNEKTEGIMYVANEDGSLAQYQGVSYSRKYYRTYAMNGLEEFSLNIKGSSAYSHIRISTDNGETWKYLGQSGSTGLSTGNISIPVATGEEHSVVKVMVQLLDDATYTANIKAQKDGFADSTPDTYSIWVEQIPVIEESCDILTAVTDHGDWYPAFAEEFTNYRMIVANGAEAPVLAFTVSEGVKVTVGETELVADADGKYKLTLTNSSQEILLTSPSGVKTKTYMFGYSEKTADVAPDKVVDFLSINSQYTNGSGGGGYGINPQQTLTGGLLSLGNFGGYVTFYMEDGLTDDPKNAYGVDFYIDGNAFKDTSTGTGLGSMEPGQVWVSENGTTWYALAGSEHYESSTIWDYSVTYTKTATGGIDWADNQGNTKDRTHGRSYNWPKAEYYYLNNLVKGDSITLTGILLPCIDGTVAGTDSFGSLSKGAKFGYVDTLVNGRNNPYLENDKYQNASSGFDLAWAVDAEGNPVDVSDKSFHYVKVVTASNLMAGAANEKSTEVADLIRATAKENAVGVTTAPEGVTISGGTDSKEVSFTSGKQIYEVALGDMEYISIKVNGTAADDNVYINNIRVENGEAAEGIKVTGTKDVRIIVQNGEKEPVIYLLKLTNTVSAEDDLLEQILLNVGGASRVATTKDGVTYTAEVAYRIDEIKIQPKVVDGVVFTVNGEELKDSYSLVEGENIFKILATKQTERALLRNTDITQEVTLIVTRENVPESTGEITVYFTMLGDSDHEDTADLVHTLKDNNLETWVPTTAYTVDSPVVVLDIFEKVMDEYGWTFKNSGNYISEVNGLAEFKNGATSGWMYTLNGVHSELGVAEQTLEDGDIIVFHYTDDYTIEDYSTGEEVKVEFVEGLIADIGTVSLDSADAVYAARISYEKLTEEQKAQVTNYKQLLDAEAVLKTLKEELIQLEGIYVTTGDNLESIANKTTPIVGTYAGEWLVIGLERSGRVVPSGYYNNVISYVNENINEKGQIHPRKSTDNARVVLGLTAAGYDSTDVAGYNLLEGLTDMDYVTWQGNNGAIYALLAFDAHDYEIPDAPAGADQVTRDKLVYEIIASQLTDGGWNVSKSQTTADADMTGMAIQALAPYYSTNEDVRVAIDKALAYLSNTQLDNGSFGSSDGSSVESCAQVIVALTALGINPDTDARFVKNGHSVIDALCTFYLGDGNFAHVLNGNKDSMATEQAYYALTAYFRLLNGQTSLYDMSDVVFGDNDANKPSDNTGDIDKPSDNTGNKPGTDTDNDSDKDSNKKPGFISPGTGDFTDGAGMASLWIVIAVAVLVVGAVAYRRRQSFR